MPCTAGWIEMAACIPASLSRSKSVGGSKLRRIRCFCWKEFDNACYKTTAEVDKCRVFVPAAGFSCFLGPGRSLASLRGSRWPYLSCVPLLAFGVFVAVLSEKCAESGRIGDLVVDCLLCVWLGNGPSC